MRDLAIRSRYSGVKSAPDNSSSAAALSMPSNSSSRRSRASAIFCLCGLGIAASATIFAFLGTGLSLLIAPSFKAARPEPPPAEFAADPSTTSNRGLTDTSVVGQRMKDRRRPIHERCRRAKQAQAQAPRVRPQALRPNRQSPGWSLPDRPHCRLRVPQLTGPQLMRARRRPLPIPRRRSLR